MRSHQSSFHHSLGYQLDYLVEQPDEVTGRYLHVFLHGLSRIESQAPPVFARRAWSRSLSSVCLFLSDPIHRHTTESACGWYLLGEDEFLPRVLGLARKLVAEHDLDGVIWQGLCSGGYSAIRYCIRSERPDMAFVISPHEDPRALPQWAEEAAPFADLPGMAAPQRTTELLERTELAPDRPFLYAVVSEKDAYYAIEHLRPIVEFFGDDDRLRAVVLHNGRGHGFISDDDYSGQLATAIAKWAAFRTRVPSSEGTATAAIERN